MTKFVLPSSPARLWPASRGAIADVLLLALLSGPVAAPFLTATGLFPLPLIAHIIYFMGDHVCPQPDLSVMLNPPHLMAVCMRCYGVLLALLTTRLLFWRDRGAGIYWLKQYRFAGAAIATGLTSAYLLEMLAEQWGWWEYSNPVVTLFGYLTGLGIGLFLVPVIYQPQT
ncbi:MAG: DUF2085 domain-containing protein [Leptolyngbyaceae cyanobacterium bins.349]|nr:DUF2085 domain-containing protein [Leptolyngbyaceae cyanobacterium bins.349]